MNVRAWNASFLKSRLIPGDEATASNGKGVKEGTRQEERERRDDGRSPAAERTIAAPQSVADKQIAN